MFFIETEFGSSKHSFNCSLKFDEVPSNPPTEKSLERSPKKNKHYKHEISYLENLT